MREALRVLEAMRVVEIRKGISGGVFVADVDMKTTLLSIMNFIRFEAVSIKDITLMRFILEPSIIRIVSSLITEEDLKSLKTTIESEYRSIPPSDLVKGIGFHRHLARLTHNPILIVIMDFIDSLISDLKIRIDLGSEFYQHVRGFHEQVLHCLENKDVLGAIKGITADILFVGDFMARKQNTQPFDPAVLGFDPEGENYSCNGGGLEKNNQSDAYKTLLNNQHQTTTTADKSEDLIFRHLGTGELYRVVKHQDGNSEKN